MILEEVPTILRQPVEARLIEIDLAEATAVAEAEYDRAKTWAVLRSFIFRDLTAELGHDAALVILNDDRRLPLGPPAGFAANCRSWWIVAVGTPFADDGTGADDEPPDSDRVLCWYAAIDGEWRRQQVKDSPFTPDSPGVPCLWQAVVSRRGERKSAAACPDLLTAVVWLIRATRE